MGERKGGGRKRVGWRGVFKNRRRVKGGREERVGYSKNENTHYTL